MLLAVDAARVELVHDLHFRDLDEAERSETVVETWVVLSCVIQELRHGHEEIEISIIDDLLRQAAFINQCRSH